MKKFSDSRKKKVAKDLNYFGEQINKDISFWITYRPSTWIGLIPKGIKKRIIQFFSKKNYRCFAFSFLLIICLVFIGFVRTINFIFSNLWIIWLIPVLICLTYWTLALLLVYLRVIALFFDAWILTTLSKLFDR